MKYVDHRKIKVIVQEWNAETRNRINIKLDVNRLSSLCSLSARTEMQLMLQIGSAPCHHEDKTLTPRYADQPGPSVHGSSPDADPRVC